MDHTLHFLRTAVRQNCRISDAPHARAVRDHLADCLTTLPALLESGNPASLHFYFANFKGMRRELFPHLLDACHHWPDSGSLNRLADEAQRGGRLWQETAAHLLGLYRMHGEESKAHHREGAGTFAAIAADAGAGLRLCGSSCRMG